MGLGSWPTHPTLTTSGCAWAGSRTSELAHGEWEAAHSSPAAVSALPEGPRQAEQGKGSHPVV